jgi:hypothetical protein
MKAQARAVKLLVLPHNTTPTLHAAVTKAHTCWLCMCIRNAGARRSCMVSSYATLVWEVAFSSILLIESIKATLTDNATDSKQDQQRSTAITMANNASTSTINTSCALVVCHLPPLLQGGAQGLRVAARTLYFTSTAQAVQVAKVIAARAPWATIDVAPASNNKSVSIGVRAVAQKVRPMVVTL